ncbi:OPT oligopeptide transporter protein-domain-containing protein [Apodospora peruviana]|uniref:OPT oligopeptide transporter protein-domain-containing protein n=1 Tax=Apodospora peruviana TaxID=516989 RepID=A0AAE0LYY0_9PEZI|nr:OPT oligopeptide transporter protein-domain-containing protein [Apodospora peruviana]
MADYNEKDDSPPRKLQPGTKGVVREKEVRAGTIINDPSLERVVEDEFNMTERDLQEAKTLADQMSTADVRALMEQVIKIHAHDPNFPDQALAKATEFLANDDVFENPEDHTELIYEMKLEAALITTNSPYSEVRAVVDNRDDPTMPSSTIRAWIIGLSFSCLLGFINQLFSIRMPSIGVGSNVAQLLAFPVGKLLERTLPDWGFTLWDIRHSLNPGRFSRKEHMLITIMANVAGSTPYTNSIIWIQYLPQFFNQSYAGSFSYQILVALSTNLVGYGIAGLTRRFLVYPSYCVWPTSLTTIALNNAFHDDNNTPIQGPFRRTYSITRYKFFLLAFAAMFVWFWFPNYLFGALSVFSWMTWIAPNNLYLDVFTGFNNGLGLNPWPTFDWNIVTFMVDPLMVPFFTTMNRFVGMVLSGFIVVGIWYTNAYWTAFLPINSNMVWDNTASPYNVSRIIDDRGLFDAGKYEAYSPAFLSAANLTLYGVFFAVYPATLVYVALNHRYEVGMGLKNVWNGFRDIFRKNKAARTSQYGDVHNRLMAKYTEAPQWWYMALLVVAVAFGIAGIAGWETYTNPGVVFYGLALCLLFVIPVGLVNAMTGVEVTLNVLAEFIGGSLVPGNALAMNFFKSYGYVTCAHAVWFANDLKLAHYIKIPPRQTFMAQVIATLASTFVCVGILNFQMNSIPNVCTPDAPNKMTCPSILTFFTASVLWGTLGPVKMFGHKGQYTWLMIGWPIGALLPVAVWYAQKRFSGKNWTRRIHPVLLLTGGMGWAPYNLSYLIPTVPIGWLSWIWCKNRFVGFWGKYNFVLSAALSSGIAISGIVMFFALQWPEVKIDWWGNSVVSQGCEAEACVLKQLGPGEYFGPRSGEFH